MDYESEGSLGYKRRPRFKALVWGDGSVSKESAVQTCLPESCPPCTRKAGTVMCVRHPSVEADRRILGARWLV